MMPLNQLAAQMMKISTFPAKPRSGEMAIIKRPSSTCAKDVRRFYSLYRPQRVPRKSRPYLKKLIRDRDEEDIACRSPIWQSTRKIPQDIVQHTADERARDFGKDTSIAERDPVVCPCRPLTDLPVQPCEEETREYGVDDGIHEKKHEEDTEGPVLQVGRAIANLEHLESDQNGADDVDPDFGVEIRDIAPLVVKHSRGEEPGLERDRGVELSAAVFRDLRRRRLGSFD